MPDNRMLLYNNLKSVGMNVGSFEDFNNNLNDPNKLNALYKNLSSVGMNVGSLDEFTTKLKGSVDSKPADSGGILDSLGKFGSPTSGSMQQTKQGTVSVGEAIWAPIAGFTRELANMISSGFESIVMQGGEAGTNVGVNKLIEGANQLVQRSSDITTGALFDPSKRVETPRLSTLPENDEASQNARMIERQIYKFGKARRDWLDKNIVTPEQYKNSFWMKDVPEAFGQMAGFVVGGVLIGRGAGVPEWLTSGALGAITEAQSQSQQTYEQTGDLKKADITYMEGLGIGFTEAADTGILMKSLERFSMKGAIKKLLPNLSETELMTVEDIVKSPKGKETLRKMFPQLDQKIIDDVAKVGSRAKVMTDKLLTGSTEGLGEFIQESGQTVMENMSDRDLYDSNRDLMSGVAQAGSAAFWSGLLMGMIGHSARSRLLDNPQNKKLQELMDEQMKFMKENSEKLETGANRVGFFEQQIRSGATPEEAVKNISSKISLDKVENSEAFLNLQNELVGQLNIPGDEARALAHKIGTGALFTSEDTDKLSAFKDLKKWQGELKPLYHNAILDHTFKSNAKTEVSYDRDKTSEKNPEDNTPLEERAKQDISQKTNIVDRIFHGDEIQLQADVFHGSPFDFDAFSSTKIGTGEGAQAYGYGLYFTTKEEIARYYAKALAEERIIPINDTEENRSKLKTLNASYKQSLDNLNELYNTPEIKNAKPEERVALRDKIEKTDEFIKRQNIVKQIGRELRTQEDLMYKPATRNLYNVTLWEGKDQNLLNWDEQLVPISQQEKETLQEKQSKLNFAASVVDQMEENFIQNNPPRLPRPFLSDEEIAPLNNDPKYQKAVKEYEAAQKDYQNYEDKVDNASRTSDQAEKLNKAFKEAGVPMEIINGKLNFQAGSVEGVRATDTKFARGKDVYHKLSELIAGTITSKKYPGWMQGLKYINDDKAASELLKRAGFDGIQYKGDTSGATNYVVFDDNAIKIREKVQFQKENPSDIAEGTYGELLQTQDNISFARLLADKIAVRQEMEPVLRWLLNEINPEIRYVDNASQVRAMGQTFGQLGAKGAFAIHNGKPLIAINREARYSQKSDIGDTLIHELWHGVSVQKLQTDRQFRADMTELLDLTSQKFKQSSAYQRNQAYYDQVLASPEEFLANVMSGTAPILREWMANNYIDGTDQKFLRRFVDKMIQLFQRLVGNKPSYVHALEAVLNEHLQSPIFSLGISGSDIVIPEDNARDLEVESQDKSMMITEEGLENPRILLNTAKMLAEAEDKQPGDYYKYLKAYKKETLEKKLKENEDWLKKAVYHYQNFYKDKFADLDSYIRAVTTQMYNYAQSLRQVNKVRLTVLSKRDDYDDENPVYTSQVTALGNDYTDKTGKHLTSYTQDIKLFEVQKKLEQITGMEFEIVFIEEVQKVDTIGSYTADPVVTQISKDMVFGKSRNEFYAQMLEANGYLFPGTWADKNTVVALKPKKLNQAALDAIGKMYQQKVNDLVIELTRRKYGDDFIKQADKKAKADGKSIIEYIDEELRDYAQPYQMNSQVIRTVLEDIRFGAEVTSEGLQSKLFNPQASETYDAIKIFKRPYLVSPKSYVDLSGNIQGMLDQLPLKEHGMTFKDGQLMANAVVFDANPGEILYEYQGKTIDIGKILINRYGTEGTDGKILYLKGGFELMWQQLHGTLKDGAIKAWIGNSFGDSFNQPFYVKGAYHMVNEDDLLGQWMKDNKITLLISSTAAKVNSYPLSKPDPNSVPLSFQIPFTEIQRDKEKGEAKDGGRGLMQTLTTNYITPENPYFVDRGWNKGLDDVINYSTRTFNERMLSMSPGQVLEYLKSEALKGGSDFQKTIGSLVIELAWVNADKNYREFKKKLDFTEDSNKYQILAELRRRRVVTNDKIALQISKFFNDPYFAKGINDYIKKQLETVTSFIVPASWAVLGGDLGYLAGSRINQIRSQAAEAYRNRKAEEYINQARSRYKNISQELQQLNNEKETLMAAATAEKDMAKSAKLTALGAQIDEEINQLEGNLELYDENGMPDLSSKEYLDFIDPKTEAAQKEIDKFVFGATDPETGRLNFGYTIISQDIADLYGLKAGDKVMHLAVPSDSMMSAGGSVVAAVMPANLMEPNKIILNSEYIQTMVGKDFDIDTLLIIPKSEAFTDAGFDGMYNTFNESIEAHKSKMLSLYKKELKARSFKVKVEGKEVMRKAEDLTYGDILSKEIRLAFTQKFNGKSDLQRNLYNPLSDSLKLLDEYQKDIGKIVNVRKMFTLKTQIGFKSKVEKMKVDPSKTNIPVVYNLFLNMTNDMVDVPTNTNKFHYRYEFLRIMDYINGTKFYDLYQQFSSTEQQDKADQILFTAKAVEAVDKFLFERAIKAGAEYSLDDFNESKELSDTLAYIKQQQQIDYLMETGNKEALKAEYEAWLLKRNPRLKFAKYQAQKEQMIKAGKEYIDNMEIGDLSKSAAIASVEKVQLNNIPSVGMTELEYIETQTNLILSMFKREGFEDYRAEMRKTGEKYRDLIAQIAKGEYSKDGIDNNRLAVQLNLLTRVNDKLHRLKAKIVAIINPVDQTLIAPDSSKIGNFYDAIYQSVNAEAYPILIKLMFENTKAFNWNTQRRNTANEVTFNSKIGKIKFSKGPEETLLIEYNGKVGNSKQLAESNSPFATKLKNEIYGNLFKDASNRVALSNLMSLGSTNIPINLRIEAASEILRKELKAFSPKEQGLFWLSLMGKPSANLNERVGARSAQSASPTNLVLPYKGKEGSYNSQDRLYHLISTLGDIRANKFLHIYVEEFNQNYTGRDFSSSYQMEHLITSPGVFSEGKNDQVWLQADQTEWKDEDPTYGGELETVKGIIRGETVVPGSASRTQPVGKVIDFNTGEIFEIGTPEVMNATSAYVTHLTHDYGQGAVAFTKVLYDTASVNKIDSMETTRNNQIQTILNDIKLDKEKELKTPYYPMKNLLKHLKKYNMGPELEKIHAIIEENKMGIDFMVRNNEGDYIVQIGEDKYNITKDPAPLLNKLSVPFAEQNHYKAALLYIQRYAVDNVAHVQHMLDYLRDVVSHLPEGFGNLQLLNALVYKYEKLLGQFTAQGVQYFPRVFTSQVLREQFDKLERKAIEASVREKIKEEKLKHQKGNNLGDPDYYNLNTEEEIKEAVEREISMRFAHISYDQLGDYVHSFQISRGTIPNEGYIKDSTVSHQYHQRLFQNMLLNDLLFLNMLQYEFRAHREGEDIKTINKMKAWFQLISNHRLIQSKGVTKSSVKAGDHVWFYTMKKTRKGLREVAVGGIVASNDGKSIKLLTDTKTLRNQVEEEIKYFQAEHDDIINNPEGKPTEKQLATFQSLYDAGYTKRPVKFTKLNLNDAIIIGYQNLYKDADNWGKYDYKDIYGKQYEGTALKAKDAVMLQPQRSSTDQVWDTLHLITASIFLSGPAAGTTNWLDAQAGLIMDFRGWKYFKYALWDNLAFGKWKSRKMNVGRYRSQLRASMGSGDYAYFSKAWNNLMNKTQYEIDNGAVMNTRERIQNGISRSSFSEKVALAEYFAKEYALQANLHKIDRFTEMVINEPSLETTGADIKNKAYQGIKSVASSWAGTKYFNKAEIRIRTTAAFLYAYKAIVEDNLTDQREIEWAITKGIARTQSLYENMHRKLKERSSRGRFLSLFSQFQTSQKDTLVAEWDQARIQRLKFGDFFHPTATIDGKVYKAGDTIDPNIYNRWAVKWWMDTVYFCLGTLVPGMRQRSPMGRIATAPLAFLAQAIVTGDAPDDWDLRDWIFSILGIWFGLGNTIPIQIGAGVVNNYLGIHIPVISDEKKTGKGEATPGGVLDTLFPSVPRVGRGIKMIVESFIKEQMGKPDWAAEQMYWLQMLERNVIGFNFIVPAKRQFYSAKQNEFQKLNPAEKTWDLMKGILEETIPPLNLIDTSKGTANTPDNKYYDMP